MQSLVEIEPKEILYFEVEENKLAHAQMSIKNLTQENVSFQIKLTRPLLFRVKPPCGIINPNQTKIIEFSTNRPMESDEKIDNKFLINTCFIDSINSDLIIFWKSRDQSTIQQQQIRGRIKQNIQQDTQSPSQESESNVFKQNSIQFNSVIVQKVNDDQIKHCRYQLEDSKNKNTKSLKRKPELKNNQHYQKNIIVISTLLCSSLLSQWVQQKVI
ncbi:unnamed protein product [Paramecium octaurelia]|uniref:MSP domain-containing protein n=1 Tax=Paramecium octaurelia TaxID=43137 RepID=A0A8S1U023_PAROT|nr:unnamed protein product [Paramecium octaurelia]